MTKLKLKFMLVVLEFIIYKTKLSELRSKADKLRHDIYDKLEELS